MLELPHTAGCVVCGRHNPHGLRLSLYVDPDAGVVRADFVPRPEHIGFVGIIHGGILSTALDEAMVWAATWAGKRFCLAGTLDVRFRSSAAAGQALRVEARVESVRSRLIEAAGSITDAAGGLIATATAKYVPLNDERNRAFLDTLVDEPATAAAAGLLRAAAAPAGISGNVPGNVPGIETRQP